MNFFDKMGVSYGSNYLLQGDNSEKCKLSKKTKINNIELLIREDGKDSDIDGIFDKYKENVIFHLPTINFNLGNLKKVDQLVKKLLIYNVPMVTINATNLGMEDFEWSMEDEQKQNFSNIVTAIATLASNKIVIAVENTPYFGNSDGYFGQSLNHISDIIVYARKILVKEYDFTEDDASKYIGLCFNVTNLLKNNDSSEANKWFKVFGSNIKCIKYVDDTNIEINTNLILKNCLDYKINTPVLLIEENELEEVPDKYIHFVNLIKIFNKNNGLESENTKNILPKERELNDSGYTNIVMLSIIVVTIAIAILMIYVKFQ